MFYKCVFFTSSFMVPLKCIPGEQWLLKNWSEVVGSLNCKRYLMSKVVNQGIHSELESWYEIELLYHVQFQFSMNRSLCSRKTPWWPAISFLVRRHSPGARSSFFSTCASEMNSGQEGGETRARYHWVCSQKHNMVDSPINWRLGCCFFEWFWGLFSPNLAHVPIGAVTKARVVLCCISSMMLPNYIGIMYKDPSILL